MKILPLLLVNLAMVGGGIAAYDHWQGEDSTSSQIGVPAVDSVDLAALEARLVARFGAGQAGLSASGIDPRVLGRLEALEGRIASAPPPGSSNRPEPAAGTEGPAPDDGLASPEGTQDTGPEPSETEVRRFRRLMERAEQLRRDEREMERVDQMLTRLEINLSPAQKQKYMDAQRAMREKVGETWRQAMQGGGGREAAQAAMQGLRDEFTTELTKFMSIGDAQRITEEGASMMRGFGALAGGDGDVRARRGPGGGAR